MRLTVLFFGQTADLAGTRLTEQAIAPGTTVGEAVGTMLTSLPDLSGRNLLYALNEEYVAADAEVKDGDQLAIFTAVSGG